MWRNEVEDGNIYLVIISAARLMKSPCTEVQNMHISSLPSPPLQGLGFHIADKHRRPLGQALACPEICIR